MSNGRLWGFHFYYWGDCGTGIVISVASCLGHQRVTGSVCSLRTTLCARSLNRDSHRPSLELPSRPARLRVAPPDWQRSFNPTTFAAPSRFVSLRFASVSYLSEFSACPARAPASVASPLPMLGLLARGRRLTAALTAVHSLFRRAPSFPPRPQATRTTARALRSGWCLLWRFATVVLPSSQSRTASLQTAFALLASCSALRPRRRSRVGSMPSVATAHSHLSSSLLKSNSLLTPQHSRPALSLRQQLVQGPRLLLPSVRSFRSAVDQVVASPGRRRCSSGPHTGRPTWHRCFHCSGTKWAGKCASSDSAGPAGTPAAGRSTQCKCPGTRPPSGGSSWGSSSSWASGS